MESNQVGDMQQWTLIAKHLKYSAGNILNLLGRLVVLTPINPQYGGGGFHL